jgi:hypothetical protein
MEGGKYTPIEGQDETFSVREGMAKAFDLVWRGRHPKVITAKNLDAPPSCTPICK